MTLDPSTQSCAGCLVFMAYTDADKLGLCRANPPVFVNEPQSKGANFPEIQQDHWCGKFMPKK